MILIGQMNRKKDTKVLTAYLPQKLYEKVKSKAEEKEVSISELTKITLQTYLG